MPVEYLNPPGLNQNPTFSQAVVVTNPGRTIYVGGQNGTDHTGAITGDFAEQTNRAIGNVHEALAAAGADSTDVISWTISAVIGHNLRDGMAAVAPVLADRTAPPVVTVLQVAGLAVPGALVEVSVTAVTFDDAHLTA